MKKDRFRSYTDTHDDATAEVNIAPLLDMVFILLIFFVITTNFTRQTGLEVKKPNAKSAQFQGPKTLLIGISPEGTIHIHGRQVNIERLQQILVQEVNKQANITAVIIADHAARIGKAVEVMDKCLVVGIKNVSIAADRD